MSCSPLPWVALGLVTALGACGARAPVVAARSEEPASVDGPDVRAEPDADTDADRVLDASDACPREPEVYNGEDDEDGCPDRGSCTLEGLTLAIEPVRFAAGVTYAPGALAALETFASAMGTERSDVRRLAITAYAPLERGAPTRLATERAAQVREVLLAHGVAPERLVLDVLDIAQAAGADAAERVDLVVLCHGGDELERMPDGRSERRCPTGRCDDAPR